MSGLTSSTWTNQMDAPGKMRAGAKSSFEAYNGKNKLQVVTLDDKPSAPLYLQGFVDRSTPVLKLSQCVKTRMQQTDQSNPPPSPGLHNEPSSAENAEEFSPEQVSQLTTIQSWWRRIRKIREGNRKRMATPEGQTLSKIHKICQMTLSSEQANKQTIPKCDHIKARRLIFTSGYCAIVAQGKLTNAFKRAREKMRSCFNNKALTPENLAILDTLKSELVSVEKSYKDVVKQFSLGTLTMVLNSYEDLTEFEIRIEVVLARTLEIQEIVSKIRCRVDAISKG